MDATSKGGPLNAQRGEKVGPKNRAQTREKLLSEIICFRLLLSHQWQEAFKNGIRQLAFHSWLAAEIISQF